jgi:CRISPR-associated protein (TIGR03984 family)
MNQNLYENISFNEVISDDISLINWLRQMANQYHLKYLLAHAEDGVIWGRFNENNELITADSVFSPDIFDIDLPKLRLLTLQQCRIFGENGEILLWKTNKKWKARIIKDDSSVEHIPEKQILWGTQIEKGKNGENGEQNGFTLLSDGSQGLKHAVPITDLSNYFSDDKTKLYRPVRLNVKHYIKYDEETGIGRIFLSRLVSLKPSIMKIQ